jgi:hypothetical protein
MIHVDESTVVLGIETSCDETAAAVVMGGNDVLSSVVATQLEQHARFGGVVPEIASRAHVEAMTPVVRKAMSDAGVAFERIERLRALLALAVKHDKNVVDVGTLAPQAATVQEELKRRGLRLVSIAPHGVDDE